MSSSAQGESKDRKTAPAVPAGPEMDPALAADWMRRWKLNILGHKERPCDVEMGETIGWRVSPFLNGYYQGCLATGEREWVERLMDWTDSVVKRGVKEPDGFIGWPCAEDADVLDYLPAGQKERCTDVELGDAMFLRPVVLMAGEILKTPALKKEYGAKAEEYLRLAEHIFEKWESRCAWRETKEGGIWVVPPFGLDPKTGQWTDGYDLRKTDGNSLPANKETMISMWMLAMHDVTHKPVFLDRAEKWWRALKSRMRLRENGKYFVWNYWDAGVPWDTNPDGSLKHWVGVHPNGGYYDIDVRGIVAAHEHGLVFTREDIARLIATNRDYMWNKQIKNPKFQRIDGGRPDPRWANSPGVLWSALAPYDPTLRKIFEANHDPDGWGGLSGTPAWVARFGRKPAPGR